MENIEEKKLTYYFFDDMINIEDFDSNLLKIDTKLHKNIDTYYIGCITMKDYLIIDKVDGYIEEKNGNKYLTFTSVDKNKEVFIKWTELWNDKKYLIKTKMVVKQVSTEKIT